MNDDLVRAVATELAKRRRERWQRGLKLLGQVVLAIAAMAAIASGLHDVGAF